MSADEMTAWLRAQVEADKAAAEAAPGAHWRGDGEGCWAITENGREDLVLGSAWAGSYEAGVATVAHAVLHDPRDVIADCDAKLAALDLCERVIRDDAEDHDDCGAAGSWTGLAVARLAVQLLASGYRHRDGWQGEWLT